MFSTLMRKASKAEPNSVKVYDSKCRRFIHWILKLPFSSEIYYFYEFEFWDPEISALVKSKKLSLIPILCFLWMLWPIIQKGALIWQDERMNLNEISNELPNSNKVQFSGVKINECLPVIWYRLAQVYRIWDFESHRSLERKNLIFTSIRNAERPRPRLLNIWIKR